MRRQGDGMARGIGDGPGVADRLDQAEPRKPFEELRILLQSSGKPLKGLKDKCERV